MKSKGLRGPCFLLVVLCGLMMCTAQALATKDKLVLETRAAGALPAGSEFAAGNGAMVLETAAGGIECTSDEISGAFTVNESTKADKGEITSGSFTGEESGGSCKSPAGPVQITAGGFPWNFELTSKGQLKIKGSNEITFHGSLDAGTIQCTYTTKKVTGSYPQGTEVPLELHWSTSLKVAKASNTACSKLLGWGWGVPVCGIREEKGEFETLPKCLAGNIKDRKLWWEPGFNLVLFFPIPGLK